VGEDEFRKLFDAEYVYVCRTLRRLGVRERDVEDLAQELFVVVHRQLSSFDRSRAARPWLYAFVVRLAANYRRLRRHRDELAGLAGDGVDEHHAPHAQYADDRATRDLVLRALDLLDDEKRDVLVLYHLEGFEAQEIAEMSAIPTNTVYSRVRLAREAFRRAVSTLNGVSTNL
jgi:RNA polymerase sigma-70 factor (ECF subfamily)